MDAGRELDALVAEQVMRLSVVPLALCYEERNADDGRDGWSGFYCPRCGVGESDSHTTCAAPYSTSIAAAWLVVEHLIIGKYCILVGSFRGRWSVQITDNGNMVVIQEAATAPLAICRAALKVVTPERSPL